MTNYLLTNGEVTSNIVEYAVDYIKAYLILRYNDIPYSPFGNNMNLTVNIKSEVLYQVRMAINTALAKLNSEFPNLNGSLSSISFSDDSRLNAEISMSNYTIKLAI